MTAQWEQPIRPLEYKYQSDDLATGWSPWLLVVFIRPTHNGYEIMGPNGVVWESSSIFIQEKKA